MSPTRFSRRMKPHCCVQVWRIKLVLLSVVLVLFYGTEAESMSIADGIEIGDFSGNQKQFNGGASQSGPRHRIRMLFPLLLSISSRLAQIVSMAVAATIATFLMALFAKKALLISLATFGLVIYDKFKTKSQVIIHRHVQPTHKNYVSDDYYVTPQPHKYAGYTDGYDGYHNSHTQKHYSRHKPHEDSIDFILQDITAKNSRWYPKYPAET